MSLTEFVPQNKMKKKHIGVAEPFQMCYNVIVGERFSLSLLIIMF